MYYIEEIVSFRSLRIGYELQGARSQIERALESTRSVVGVYPEDSLERALEHIEKMQSGICSLCRASLGARVTATAPRRSPDSRHPIHPPPPPAFEQGDFPFFTDLGMVYNLISFTGMSPSGKASGFGPDIRGFESLHPNQSLFCCPTI